jgi:hypothetical protein
LRYSPDYGIWRSDRPQDAPSALQTEDGAFDSMKHEW